MRLARRSAWRPNQTAPTIAQAMVIGTERLEPRSDDSELAAWWVSGLVGILDMGFGL